MVRDSSVEEKSAPDWRLGAITSKFADISGTGEVRLALFAELAVQSRKDFVALVSDPLSAGHAMPPGWLLSSTYGLPYAYVGKLRAGELCQLPPWRAAGLSGRFSLIVAPFSSPTLDAVATFRRLLVGVGFGGDQPPVVQRYLGVGERL